MYEIERYVQVNTLATASFLEAMIAMSPRPARLVVASSMSIYGEGEYECTEHGTVAPPPRSEEQLLARNWECMCPYCGKDAGPDPNERDQIALPDLGLCGDEARP